MASNKFGDIMTNAEAYNLLRDVNEEQLFYASKQHSKFLDLLTHLSRYSNLMLTLVGPTGSGKTHIKNRFLSNLDSGVVVSKMHGDNVADVKDLSARIAQTFNLENHSLSTVSTLIAEFRQNIEAFTEDGKSCLIVIDNAEKLTDASIQLLLELANTHEDSQRPHIVLIGRNEIADRLQTSPHKVLFEPVGHLLELSPFTEEETARYMEYRMRSVGIKVFPFNDNDFNDIYAESKGWAGRINDALLNYFKGSKGNKVLPNNKLTSVKRQSTPKDKGKKSKSKNSYLFPLLSAIIFIVLAALMYFFSGAQKNPLEKDPDDKREATILGQRIKSASSDASLEDLDTSKSKSLFEKNKSNFDEGLPKDAQITQPLAPDAKAPQASEPKTQIQNPQTGQAEQTEQNNIQEKDQAVKGADDAGVEVGKPEGVDGADGADGANNSNTNQQTGVDSAFTSIDAGKDEAPKIIDLTDVEPQPVESITKADDQNKAKDQAQTQAQEKPQKGNGALPPKPVVPDTVKQVETTVAKQKNAYNKEEWLMQQARFKYTLQFFGSHTEKNVIGFIENQPANIRKDFVYYESTLNNKAWFVVVKGVYANRGEAVKAIEKLPASLQKMKPWAHSFGGIQDDIKGK